MSRYGAATLRRIDREGEEAFVVVDQADQTIGLTFELLEQAREAGDMRLRGSLEFDPADGNLIHFGTEGAGLGRLTYRILERNEVDRVAIARRVS